MIAADVEKKHCSRCWRLMVLERVVPKFGPLPERRNYKCLECGDKVTIEMGKPSWSRSGFAAWGA
jgi:hypothetical protein